MKKYFIPANAPPPITVTPRSTQKDSIEVVSTTKRLLFDDLETMEKPPVRVRQGDSMTTRVNKVVNTSIAYIPLSSDVPTRVIAPLPDDSLQVLHPGAVLVECPPGLMVGMNARKPINLPVDPNQILECHSYR